MTAEQRMAAGCKADCRIKGMHYHCDQCNAPITDKVYQGHIPCPRGGRDHLIQVCESCYLEINTVVQ